MKRRRQRFTKTTLTSEEGLMANSAPSAKLKFTAEVRPAFERVVRHAASDLGGIEAMPLRAPMEDNPADQPFK